MFRIIAVVVALIVSLSILTACGGNGSTSLGGGGGKAQLAQKGAECIPPMGEQGVDVLCDGGVTNISSAAIGNITVVVTIYDRSGNVLGKKEGPILEGGLVPNGYSNWTVDFEPTQGSLDGYDHFKVEYKAKGSTIPYEDWGGN